MKNTISGAIVLISTSASYYFTTSISFASLLTASAIAAVMLWRMEELAEISFGPMKAKLSASIDEANATVDQLKLIALTISSAFLSDLIASSFVGGISLQRRLEMRTDISNGLRRIGATDDDIREVEAEFSRGIDHIYTRAVRDAIREELKDDDEYRERVLEALNTHVDFSRWYVSPISDIRSEFRKVGYQPSEEVEEWLGDFEHFRETRNIRRQNEFAEK